MFPSPRHHFYYLYGNFGNKLISLMINNVIFKYFVVFVEIFTNYKIDVWALYLVQQRPLWPLPVTTSAPVWFQLISLGFAPQSKITWCSFLSYDTDEGEGETDSPAYELLGDNKGGYSATCQAWDAVDKDFSVAFLVNLEDEVSGSSVRHSRCLFHR